MRGTRFSCTPMVCILALLLAIYSAWGEKPSRTRTEYGYAILSDGNGYGLRNDGKGPYVHKDKQVSGYTGEDLVEITTDDFKNPGALVRIEVILGQFWGQLWWEDPDDDSERRVLFLSPLPEFIGEDEDLPLYDKLAENIADPIHLRVKVYNDPTGLGWRMRVEFRVDAITRSMLELLAVDTTRYWFASGEDWQRMYRDDQDHLVYYLSYPGVVESDLQNLNITPSGGPVDLFVFKSVTKGKGRPGTYSPEVLATFGGLPFRLDVSSLPEGSAAPGKHRVLSTFWGEVKTK